jgi:hypothetical protein
MIFENGWVLEFKEMPGGMFGASVSDGTNEKSIPLLFEKDRISVIEEKMSKLNLKDPTLEYFRLVVAGCIRISCRY